MDDRTARILSDTGRGLRQHYGPRLCRIVLFGSQARGEADPESDIDLLVILKPPLDPSSEIRATSALIAEIGLRHDCLVSCQFATEVRYQTDPTPFFASLRREGVRL